MPPVSVTSAPPANRRFSALLLVASLSLSLILGSTMQTEAQDTRSSPIAKAILNRDLGAVRSLIQSGEDVDQPLFMNGTPAIMAASSESWDIVKYLLDQGANPGARDDGGLSLAMLAKTSRVAPDTKEGRALAEVKKILSARGLL